MYFLRLLLLFFILILLPAASFGQLLPGFGEARSGTSGFQYLQIGVDARSSAMGFSSVADADDASGLYWNPAMTAQLDNSQAIIGHTQYFADISMNYVGYVHRIRDFSIGASLQMLDSGEMEETTELQRTGTGRNFRTIHLAAGLTVGQELSSLFSYGVTVKYLNERIEEVTTQTALVDVGFFYRVGDTGLRFAVGLNHFGLDATPGGDTRRRPGPNESDAETDDDGYIVYDEFSSISPPTTFIIGSAFDVLDRNGTILTLTGQVTNPADSQEQFSLGTELNYLNRFFIRGGYEFSTDEAYLPSFGAGFRFPLYDYAVRADYGFNTREYLGSMHRISLRFDL